MQKFQIAVYMRLSKEDDKNKESEIPSGHTSMPCGNKEESNSIIMQRMLLHRYVEEHFTDYELHEFCDDGYTGTNFERPGMQDMLEQVRNGGIDCIIVKDFSRFARDYIELGSYLEQIFPFLGVRFISVNDNYDSKDYQGSIADIDVNFKNLLYDLYSKDLSGKVRSSLAVRKEQGQYISANTPFGYEKDPKDRHALLIAEDEAEVVKRIFALTVEGYTSIGIARLFNETHIKTPIEFKIEKGKTSRIPKGDRFLWNSSTICQILRNEIYIGNIVQKKYEKDFVGGKNHIKPREEWLTGCNHHEPIIDKELFDEVQKGRGKKRNPQHNPSHPLTGKLICGCCKKNLRYRTCLNPYFTCHNRYSNTMEHCVDKVNTMFLEQYVLFMFQDKLQADRELEQFCMEEADRRTEEIKELKENRSLLLSQMEKLRQQNFEHYQEYACGKTERFHSDESMVKSIENELAALNERIQELEEAHFKRKDNDGLYAGTPFSELSKEMIDRYIDKIVVYDEQHIEILWKKTAGA